MSAFNFDTPSRQSARGIIVILGLSIYKVLRATIILLVAFFFKYIQSDKTFNLWDPKFIFTVVAIFSLSLILAILNYRNFIFYVTKEFFVLKKGILNKEEVSVAKAKIQNVYIKQNVLQQLISVVSLSIETAGDDKTEIEIKALSKPKARALKEVLLSNYTNKDETIVDENASRVFFKATIWRLFLEGVSENHLKSFVLIFGFIVGTYNNLKDFIEQLKITSSIKNWFNLDYKSLMGLILFNVSLVLVLILFSFLFSLVRTFIQNFDLTVIRKNEGLEISKGLLNKLNLELKASRIQNTTISTNRFKSALGLYQLAFTQAMVNKKQRQKFNIIGLSRVQINALLDQFYPMALIDIVKHKPNIYYVQRIWYISILPIISLNFAFYFISVSLILINIPLILLIGLATHYSFKKKYYSIGGNNIVIGGGGLIDTYTSLLEISKIQAITLSQTIFQKRRGLASLKIYSASRPLVIPHIEIFQAQNIKNYLLFKVESENKDWM